jgi:hypothetical protein
MQYKTMFPLLKVPFKYKEKIERKYTKDVYKRLLLLKSKHALKLLQLNVKIV